MTEISNLALPLPGNVEIEEPELAQPEALHFRERAIKKLASVALNATVIAKEIWSDKEKRFIAMGLGAIGAATTFLEYSNTLNGLGQPFDILRGSGRHLDVGYLSAMAAQAKYRFKSFGGMVCGMVGAGIAGDVFIEGAQSIAITGVAHDGWGNVGDFVLPKEVVWGNIQDAAVAVGAAGYAAIRGGVKRNSQDANTQ